MAHLRGYPNKDDRSAYFNYNLRSKRAAEGPFEFGLVIGDPCDHSAFFKKCKTAGFRYRRNVLPRRIEISFRGGRRIPLYSRMLGTASNSRLNHFLPFNLGITTKFVVRYRRADIASTKTALDPAVVGRHAPQGWILRSAAVTMDPSERLRGDIPPSMKLVRWMGQRDR